MASAAVRAWEGVSRWEKSFFVGVGRVEDGALAALGHLVMSSIVISLRRALRVIRCVGGRALAGLGISGCVLVPVRCSSCRTVFRLLSSRRSRGR